MTDFVGVASMPRMIAPGPRSAIQRAMEATPTKSVIVAARGCST